MTEWMPKLKLVGVALLAAVVGAFVFWIGQWQITRYRNEQALYNAITREVIPILQFNLQQGTLKVPPQLQAPPPAAPATQPATAPPADPAPTPAPEK